MEVDKAGKESRRRKPVFGRGWHFDVQLTAAADLGAYKLLITMLNEVVLLSQFSDEGVNLRIRNFFVVGFLTFSMFLFTEFEKLKKYNMRSVEVFSPFKLLNFFVRKFRLIIPLNREILVGAMCYRNMLQCCKNKKG